MTFAAPLTHTVRDHHSHLAAYAPRSATPGATLAALERAVSVRGTSGPVVTAAIVLAHLRGEHARADVGMALVDALLADAAPRAALTDALSMLGAARGVALLRRALRCVRDEEAVREVGEAMVALAFRDASDEGAVERHLCVATLARHPTLWTYDVRWLAAHGLPCSRDAMERALGAAA
jgi:hypothetical protein